MFSLTSNISPYKLLYFALRVAGFMSKDGRPWSLIYSILQVFLMTSFITLAFLQVFLGNEELEKLVLTLSSLAIYIQVYIKLLVMLANENKIRILIERMQKYRLQLLKYPEHQDHIIEADKTCRKFSKFFSTLFVTFPIFSFITNFINDYATNFQQPHLTHQLWIPWYMKAFWGYTAASVFVTVMTVSGCVIYAACGVLQFTFTFQMSAYLRILLDRLETKGAADKTIYEHHKKLNQFLQDYNEIYSGQLFVEIMVASLMPCGFGYTIIKGFKNNRPPGLDIYHELVLCCFGPFFMYYCGQEISTQMEKLHESTYMSNWYEEKPKVRRDLYTMMLVTVRPVTLNYRLFITFDMKCGTAIVQGIYSYLMMINHFETAD